MNKDLDKLHDKLDKLTSDVSEIKTVQAVQDIVLKANAHNIDKHILRTDQLEERLVPAYNLVITIKNNAKLITVIGSIVGIVVGITKIMSFF